MPADINPFRDYTPNNRLRQSYEPVKRMEVSGGGGYYTRTTYTVESYRVRITYEGSVNIGERTIIDRTVPNYWEDYSVQQEARVEMDKASPPIDCEYLLCLPAKLVYWILCCPCAYSSHSDESNRKYNHYLDIAAGKRLERDILALLKDADKQVSERVAYQGPSQTRISVTPDRLYQPARDTDPSQYLLQH